MTFQCFLSVNYCSMQLRIYFDIRVSHPRLSMVPSGLGDGKDSGTVVYLVGQWESQGLPMVPSGLGNGKDSGTVVYLVGQWESQGLPMVPSGLGDGKGSGTVVYFGRTVGVPRYSHVLHRTWGCPDRTWEW